MSGASKSAEKRASQRLFTVLRGKYTLTRVLGVGGMGSVYLGVHRNTHRVAVKILHPELSVDEGVRARFLREGYVANSIGHAGAVRVLDDDVAEDGAAFLVMELLEGETLERRRRRLGGRLPLREVLALGRELCDVLAAAHDKGIVHRDIKPENLFITREKQLKVLDFGIARVAAATSALGTIAGSRVGTPAFMPPEQALGRAGEVDARTDLWAAGATMFTLAAGRFVHDAEAVEEIIVRAATLPAPSLAEAAPRVPAEVVAIIDRALAFKREERWPSARSMRDAIDEVFTALHGEAPGPAAIGDVPRADEVTVSQAPGESLVEPLAATTPARSTRGTASAETRETPSAETRDAPSTGLRMPTAPTAPPTASEDAPPPTHKPRRVTTIVLVAALIAGAVALFAPRQPPSAPAVSASAAPARCADARGCVAALGKPAICRQEDGACVPLEAEGCKLLAEPSDIGNEATVWIGSMHPFSRRSGPESVRAIDLARRDFATAVGGLPPRRPGEPKRPIAVVACDDSAEPARVATHLVDELRVPAVIGFAGSKEVLDLAASHFGPRGVLALAANTATMLNDIPGRPRLVWRTTVSSGVSMPATAAIIEQLFEPTVRKRVLRPGEPMRFAFCRVDNASGAGYASAIGRALRFNGKTVLENGENFRQVLIPEGDDWSTNDEVAKRIGAALAVFAPHVILCANDRRGRLVREVEGRWPARAARARWIFDTLDSPEQVANAREHPDLRGRLFTVATPITPHEQRFEIRYKEVFPEARPIFEGAVIAPYDAFYVFAYAAAAVGDAPLTGHALARAIPRLLPPADPIEVGPSSIYAALNALAAGRNIDLQGAQTTLDFDVETGDPAADFAVACLDANSAYMESGLIYSARTGRVSGTWACPTPL